MNPELRQKLQSLYGNKPVLAGFVAIVCLAIAWLTGLVTEYLVILVCLGIILISRWALGRRRRHIVAHTRVIAPGDADDTAELPMFDQGDDRPPKPRQLRSDSDGRVFLVINKRKTTRKYVFSRPTREVINRHIRLEDSHLVSKSLAKRSSFEPTEGESTVYVFTRLHWWEHAPKQIGLVLAAAILTATLVWSLVSSVVIVNFGLLVLAWLIALIGIALIGIAGAYLYVWIPWYYTWLVITDRRILLKYDPPLWLEGSPTQSVLFSDVGTSNHFDQSGFINWVLRGAGQTEFGIIAADTAAGGDEWINQGIKYVRHPEGIKRVIDEQLMAAQSLLLAQHTEDMDYQRRQAIASEEMRDLLHTHLERNP